WGQTYSESAKKGTVTPPQLSYGIVEVVGDPDVDSVRCDALGAVYAESPERGAVAREQLGDVISGEIRYPNVRAIKCNPARTAPYRERSLRCTVTGAQFRNSVIPVVGHPH